MRMIGLLVAFVAALAAGYVALQIFSVKEKPEEVSVVSQPSKPDFEQTSIITASRDIPIGTVITQDMVASTSWPKHLLLPQFITSGEASSSIIGQVTRSNLSAQEPIMRNKLANPSDPNFLAAALPAGKRVATISTDSVSSISGFVYPGDFVDVMVTHTVEAVVEDPRSEDATRIVKESVTETLLTNIKVLAVDSLATGSEDPTKKKMPTTVSLEVTLDEAQRLRLAQNIGYVSLALRSLKDKDTLSEGGATRLKDFSYLVSSSDDEQEKRVERENPVVVVRGVKVEDAQKKAKAPKVSESEY